MKKSALINSELSYIVSTLGHTDEMTICDAGLPIPDDVQRIDLALTLGIPSFLDTVRVYLSEAQIESVLLAEEFKTVSPELHDALMEMITSESQATNKTIAIQYVSHEEFKVRTQASKAIVRTGECTPYANVVFQSGVVF
ncbi:D-ribose pyranase [Vibrio sp. 10N.261.51.F12]|uniref:D-ribose pyranase n=1 Tax=Vibrio sp. 10N.261.51.F12 TaxID=3229679 RepID=UPI003551D5D1